MKPALYLIPVLVATVFFLIRAEFRKTQRQIYVLKPISTLLVTHWLEAIPPSCREVVCLKGGRIVHRGPTAELDADRLGALYA